MRFNLRRLGLLAGKAARRFSSRARLTPQRVDLMLLVRRERMAQVEIARELCVSPSVVSRMLDALVELGIHVDSILDSRPPHYFEGYAAHHECGA